MVSSKNAFTMIELIFAIVLIALVVMAVPQMISRNDRTLQGNLVQQELYVAAKAASEMLTQPWDANSPDNTTSLAYGKVLDTNGTPYTCGTAGAYDRICDNSGTFFLPFRIGHIQQPNHRRFHGDYTYSSSQIPNATSSPDIPADDTLTIATGYSGDTATSVFQQTPSATTVSNVKVATITVTNINDANRTVTLRLYMANIGETAYAKRSF